MNTGGTFGGTFCAVPCHCMPFVPLLPFAERPCRSRKPKQCLVSECSAAW